MFLLILKMYWYINYFLLNITHYIWCSVWRTPHQWVSVVKSVVIPLTILCLEEMTDRYFISVCTRMVIAVSQIEKIWQCVYPIVRDWPNTRCFLMVIPYIQQWKIVFFPFNGMLENQYRKWFRELDVVVQICSPNWTSWGWRDQSEQHSKTSSWENKSK